VIPNVFFTTLLPEMSDPAELLVAVYLFFAIGRQAGSPRRISYTALRGQQPLMRALDALRDGAEPALRRGLSLAVDRGTLLRAEGGAKGEEVYLLNTDVARRTLAEHGLLAPDDTIRDDEQGGTPSSPNIYGLYEENIGSLPPLLVEELAEAEREYPAAWVIAAFREAVANNRRSWRYISRILQRWKLEGPDYETTSRRPAPNPGNRRRVIGGPYRRVVERSGSDGERS
jgi:DNA replication protein